MFPCVARYHLKGVSFPVLTIICGKSITDDGLFQQIKWEFFLKKQFLFCTIQHNESFLQSDRTP